MPTDGPMPLQGASSQMAPRSKLPPRLGCFQATRSSDSSTTPALLHPTPTAQCSRRASQMRHSPAIDCLAYLEAVARQIAAARSVPAQGDAQTDDIGHKLAPRDISVDGFALRVEASENFESTTSSEPQWNSAEVWLAQVIFPDKITAEFLELSADGLTSTPGVGNPVLQPTQARPELDASHARATQMAAQAAVNSVLHFSTLSQQADKTHCRVLPLALPAALDLLPQLLKNSQWRRTTLPQARVATPSGWATVALTLFAAQSKRQPKEATASAQSAESLRASPQLPRETRPTVPKQPEQPEELAQNRCCTSHRLSALSPPTSPQRSPLAFGTFFPSADSTEAPSTLGARGSLPKPSRKEHDAAAPISVPATPVRRTLTQPETRDELELALLSPTLESYGLTPPRHSPTHPSRLRCMTGLAVSPEREDNLLPTHSLALQGLISPPRRSLGHIPPLRPTATVADQPPFVKVAGAFRPSLEESLLGNAVPSSKRTPVVGFTCKIAGTGPGADLRQVKFALKAHFVEPLSRTDQGWMPPYVAHVNLRAALEGQRPRGRYRLARRGSVQVVVSNPEHTGVKVFLVPYNLQDMPAGSRTFLRQRTYVRRANTETRRVLTYSIHLQLETNSRGALHLVGDMRMVFASQPPAQEDTVETETLGPQPVYSPKVKRTRAKSAQPAHTVVNASEKKLRRPLFRDDTPPCSLAGNLAVSSDPDVPLLPAETHPVYR